MAAKATYILLLQSKCAIDGLCKSLYKESQQGCASNKMRFGGYLAPSSNHSTLSLGVSLPSRGPLAPPFPPLLQEQTMQSAAALRANTLSLEHLKVIQTRQNRLLENVRPHSMPDATFAVQFVDPA